MTNTQPLPSTERRNAKSNQRVVFLRGVHFFCAGYIEKVECARIGERSENKE